LNNLRTTVLIVDDERGFVYWLGGTLDAAEYRSLPARSIADATTLLEELSIRIDLLVLNPSLRGAGEFVSTLRRSQSPMKVIALTSIEAPVPTLPDVDLWRSKSLKRIDKGGTEWVQLVQNLLAESSARSWN